MRREFSAFRECCEDNENETVLANIDWNRAQIPSLPSQVEQSEKQKKQAEKRRIARQLKKVFLYEKLSI